MSEIAGRISVDRRRIFPGQAQWRQGVLLGWRSRRTAGKVVVIGGGTSGVNAARMAAPASART